MVFVHVIVAIEDESLHAAHFSIRDAATGGVRALEKYLDRLADNEVPVSAVVYFDDMYVDAGLSLETASRVGNVRAWVTNEYEHDGLRADPGRLLGRLRERLLGPA